MQPMITKENARLCASVVKEVAHAQGIVRDPAAIGRLIAAVGDLYNRVMHDRDELLKAALKSVTGEADTPLRADEKLS